MNSNPTACSNAMQQKKTKKTNIFVLLSSKNI